MLQCTILGVDPMQRLWRNIGGALPHCGAQMLELQVVQYEADERRPPDDMLSHSVGDG